MVVVARHRAPAVRDPAVVIREHVEPPLIGEPLQVPVHRREPDARERAHNIALAKVGVGQAGRFVSQNAVQLI